MLASILGAAAIALFPNPLNLFTHPLDHLSIRAEKGKTGKPGDRMEFQSLPDGQFKVVREGYCPYAVNVVVTNKGKWPVELWVRGPGGELLDFHVRRGGRAVSEGNYSDRAARPLSEPLRAIRIEPGKSHTIEAVLILVIPREERKPGDYRVWAFLRYQGREIEAPPFTLTVLPDTDD